MSKSRGLFDEQIRLEKLSKKQDPLEKLSSHNKDGIIVHKGKIIDASIVEVPKQRNDRQEK